MPIRIRPRKPKAPKLTPAQRRYIRMLAERWIGPARMDKTVKILWERHLVDKVTISVQPITNRTSGS